MTDTNIDSYLLVTFNDFGPDIKKNVQVYPPTPDVNQFKRDTLGIVFESFDGGRDSKERLTQGKQLKWAHIFLRFFYVACQCQGKPRWS